jgi:hypothetical protein
MITKYVQLWFAVPKHQVEMVWGGINSILHSRGLCFINLPDGTPPANLPLTLEWSQLPAHARPAFARSEADWERYCGNRRDIKIVSFIVSGLGRSIEEVLQDWQALSQQGVFLGGSWASGFDAPDPFQVWNYAGKLGHPQGGGTCLASITS